MGELCSDQSRFRKMSINFGFSKESKTKQKKTFPYAEGAG